MLPDSVLVRFALVAIVLMAVISRIHAQTLDFVPLGTYQSGIFDAAAAEIAAFDPGTDRLYVVNAAASTVTALDASDPSAPARLFNLDLNSYGASANSVAVRGDLLAVAMQASLKTDPGSVVFFSNRGRFLGAFEVCALPDALAFSPDGRYVVVACEGEPNSYGQPDSVDPEGAVAIVDLGLRGNSPGRPRPGGPAAVNFARVAIAGFADFNVGGSRASELPAGVRIFGPGATVAQDLEPEFVAIRSDSRTAYVTLQENNAVAVVDLTSARVERVLALGTKDHRLAGNGLDASDQDGAIRIANWPVYGMYQPDAIAAFTAGGRSYFVTANEGDVREWPGYNEALRVSSSQVVLDPALFPNAALLKQAANLGRLNVSRASGNTDGDPQFEALYAFGGRSFSVWDGATGALVYDSGDALEQLTAARYPATFNASNTNNTFDNRSDDKGPEPEGVVLGTVDGVRYAFVGLERIGGVAAFDLSNPAAPVFAGYVNRRDFSAMPGTPEAGDLGPEGLVFIAAEDSPTGQPLLVTSNETSGTVTFFQIGAPAAGKGAEAHTSETGGDGFAVSAPAPTPTPGGAVLRVDLPDAGEVRVRVFDPLGREVLTTETARLDAGAGQPVRLDGSTLAPGIYLYRVEASGAAWEATATGRLVIVR